MQIRWYLNDLQIQSNDHRIFLVNDDQYSLLINNCHMQDSGEYKAVLSNNYGEVQSKCRLNVLAKPHVKNDAVKTIAPYFVEQLKDIKINEGQDVCFKCRVCGQPEPDVRWYKDGVLIEETNNIKVRSTFYFFCRFDQTVANFRIELDVCHLYMKKKN